MEIGCDGVIIRLKTNIGNGYIRSYDARMVICFGLRMQMSQRMMLHQGNMLRFTGNMLRFTDSHAFAVRVSLSFGNGCYAIGGHDNV